MLQQVMDGEVVRVGQPQAPDVGLGDSRVGQSRPLGLSTSGEDRASSPASMSSGQFSHTHGEGVAISSECWGAALAAMSRHDPLQQLGPG